MGCHRSSPSLHPSPPPPPPSPSPPPPPPQCIQQPYYQKGANSLWCSWTHLTSINLFPVMPAVVIRQRKPFRRKNGLFIYFEGELIVCTFKHTYSQKERTKCNLLWNSTPLLQCPQSIIRCRVSQLCNKTGVCLCSLHLVRLVFVKHCEQWIAADALTKG